MMDIKNFKCNGVGDTTPAKNIKPFIQTAVSLYRLRNSSEEILEKINSIDPNDNYHIGPRFIDDESVTTRICSGLVDLASNNIGSKNTIQEDVESFVYSLCASDMDHVILEGMRDCASADHWYTFEKQW